MDKQLTTFEQQWRTRIDQDLHQLVYLDHQDEEKQVDPIFEMMDKALQSGGKRLRPLLTLLLLDGMSVDITPDILRASEAVEMVHTYSLIHDDLPAMDDDDLRRGQPTLHRVYGEGNAVLAGDGLLTLAFEMLAQLESIHPNTRLELIRTLALMSGADNMVRGQQYDLAGDQQIKNLADLEFVHLTKTGALLAYSTSAAARLAGRDELLSSLNVLGLNLGLAYQIQDDLADQGQSSDQNKVTYPGLAGVDESRQALKERLTVINQTVNELSEQQVNVNLLREFIQQVVPNVD